jgi:folylpolyglutamate synthase/dihydrofolate synthase
MEVGLGGLLDATNVVSRKDKVCVITDLGLDHVDILGKTLPEITKQKAGIITEGNHVFIYKQDLEVMHVIEEVCRQNSAVLHTYSSDKDDFLAELRLPLFQQRNMHLAIQVAAYVLDRDKQSKLTREQIRGVASIQVPARMEIFELVGKTLIIDGSHNSQKLRALANSISSEFHNQSIYALVAFVSGDDQRWQTGLDVLMYLVDGLIVTSFTSNQDFPKRSVDPDKIVEYCHKQGFTNLVVEKEPEKAFGLLTKQSQDLLLVTGSFYLLNHIRPLIKVI